MKVVKSLLLGSAAVLSAVAVAQAADLPSRKAAPAEYVKICDAYGAGFFYIPGTDTCLKVGGYVRAEYAWIQPAATITSPSFKYSGGAAPTLATSGVTFVPTGVQDQTGFLGRGRVDLDARTQTAWGTARTFVSLRAQATTGAYTGADNSLAGTLTGQTGATAVTVENAIVQFAGFTFGRTTAEIFSFMPAYNYNSFAWSGFPGGINLLSYTATFGGGFSATVGIEDRSGLSYASSPTYLVTNGVAGTNIGVNAFAGSAAGLNGGGFANGPLTWPALVGNVRLDQSWGAVQLMGAVVQNAASSVFAAGAAGGAPNVTLTAVGWSVGLGVKLNLPMLAAGDTLYVTAAYSNGDLDHLNGFSTSSEVANNGRLFGGLIRADRNLYVTPAAVLGAACAAVGTVNSSCFRTEQTTGWSVGAEFTHYWTSTIRSVLLGSYLQLNPGTVTRNTDWTAGGLSSANVWKLAGQLIWAPVKDLDIGAELTYQRLNQSYTGINGAATLNAAPGGIAAGSSVWEARMRVQRQF